MPRSPSLRLILALLLATPLAGGLLSAAPAQAAPLPKQVKILGNCGPSFFCYSPAATSVVVGQSVVWTNKSTAPHTVTRCTMAACGVGGGTGKQTGLSSPRINPGGTYRFLFQGKGTYVYYCAIHGYATMHGKVTVT